MNDIKTTDLNLTLAEDELLAEGLDTFDKLMDYLAEHGSFEPINGIGPVTNKEILNAIEETLKAKPQVTVEIKTDSPKNEQGMGDEGPKDTPETSPEEHSTPDSLPEEPIVEETPVEPPHAPEPLVEPRKTHRTPSLPANLTDIVCVTLVHARGNRSQCSKMRRDEVASFWNLNKNNWRSYEVDVCNC